MFTSDSLGEMAVCVGAALRRPKVAEAAGRECIAVSCMLTFHFTLAVKHRVTRRLIGQENMTPLAPGMGAIIAYALGHDPADLPASCWLSGNLGGLATFILHGREIEWERSGAMQPLPAPMEEVTALLAWLKRVVCAQAARVKAPRRPPRQLRVGIVRGRLHPDGRLPQ